MTTFSARLETLFSRHPRRVPGRRPGSRRLSLERLEDRTVPTVTASFASPIDLGPGPNPTYTAHATVDGDQFDSGWKLTNAVATADLNHDGRPDIVSTNVLTNTVSVFLGQAGKTFTAPHSYSVGMTPVAVVVADFNNDGNLDVATADMGSGTASLLLGRGDGSFGSAVSYSVGMDPVALAAGVFDGGTELAVAGGDAGGVKILKWSETGLAIIATVGDPTNGVTAVATGAFHGDAGRQDLVVAAGTNVTLYRNTSPDTHGALTFGTGSSYAITSRGQPASPHSLAVADFNGDGRPDVAALAWDTATVSVLLGQADGTLGSATQVGDTGELPRTIVAGDFNGDGRADLAVAAFGSSTVSILAGNGNGTFQPNVDFWAGEATTGIAAANLGSAGFADLLVGRTRGDQVSLIANNGPGHQTNDGVRIIRDVSYFHDPNNALGTTPDPYPLWHTLDIYVPPDVTNYPVILFLHGGTWTSGKEGYSYLWRSFAAQGIGVVSMSLADPGGQADYTTADKNVAMALDWVHQHIADYGGDPTRVFGAGHSSGTTYMGHVAVDSEYLHAFNPTLDPAEALRGVILFNQGSVAPTPTAGTYPPFLMISGTEGIEPQGQWQLEAPFFGVMVPAGAAVQWDIVPGYDHVTMLANAWRSTNPTRQLVLDFIAARDRGDPPTTGIAWLGESSGMSTNLSFSGSTFPLLGQTATGTIPTLPTTVTEDFGLALAVGSPMGLTASAGQPPAAAALSAGVSPLQAGPQAAAPAGMSATDQVFVEWSARMQADSLAARSDVAALLASRWNLSGEASPLDPLFDWLGGL